MILQIGKYKGQELEEIPLEYLIWFESNTNPAPPLREALNAEIKIRIADKSSIGRDPSGPSYTSFEEMLHKELVKWLVEEHTAKRLILLLNARAHLERSLATMLKTEVPRLKKLYRSQSKP
jgi:uncharacterized protein (DUF3820 family)